MQLGHYRLLNRIGSGGMGEVWKGEDTHLLRTVAVKLLRPELAGDEEWKARFLREARTAARLSHPNIATIYAVDEADGRMYIAMEYVEGESLKQLIASHVLGIPDVVRVAKLCADALAEAHTHGIIHRDVKPENIIVTKRGVKMLDFGIAKLIDAPAEDAGKLTSDGTVIGTPEYMSPEQALGKTVDHRSDIFSLGVVLFEALSGRHPFAGSSVTETLINIVMREAPDLTSLLPGVSQSLVDIVRKATQKNPDARYEIAKQMASALNKFSPANSSAMFPAVTRMDTPTVPLERAKGSESRSARASEPVARPTPSKPARGKSSSARWKAIRANLRVLVADDDPEVRRQLGAALAHHRLEYDEAENGSEAIQQLKRRKYALAFIDLMMPRIDGWAVIDFIRNHAEHRDTKTYVVAAGEQRFSAVDQDVIAGIVSKPFDPVKLDSLLESFVRSQ